MWEVEERFIVRLGGNTFINVARLIDFRGQSLFTLKRHDDNGYLGIYFEIYDPSGKHVASVKRNEIYSGDKAAYKIRSSTTQYQFVERRSGIVICTIKRYEDAHPAELDVSVRLYTPSGFLFDATPEGTNLPGYFISGNTIADCAVGIAIG
jgi:hypothetical protein